MILTPFRGRIYIHRAWLTGNELRNQCRTKSKFLATACAGYGCHDEKNREIIPLELLSYQEAVERALARIAQNHVPSSWINSLAAGTL